MLRATGYLVLAGLALLMPGPAMGARPVARVLNVRGDVTIERSKDSIRPAQVFGTVYEGEKLIVADAAQVVLAFRSDGRLVRLKPGTQATVTATGCTPPGAVLSVEIPAGRQSAVRGAVEQLKPLSHAGVTIVRSPGREPPLPPPPCASPIVGATILSPRPVFKWPAVEGVETYELTVASGGRTLWSQKTNQTELEYGAKTTLQTGFAYHWTVKAAAAGSPERVVCEGEFAVASEAQRALAEEMVALASGDDPTTISLAAAWLEENGMTAEALAACQRLAQLLPEEATVQGYLCELYGRAGRMDDASRARAAFLRLRPPPPKPPWFRSLEKKAKKN